MLKSVNIIICFSIDTNNLYYKQIDSKYPETSYENIIFWSQIIIKICEISIKICEISTMIC